jgi:hypothetical protein
MHKSLGLAAVAAFAICGAAPAEADTIFEVENARAVARSSRIVSDEQIEFLKRYGALSGTPGIRRGDTFSYEFDGEGIRYHHRPLRRHRWR